MGPLRNKTVHMSQLQYSIFVAFTWRTDESLPLTACMSTCVLAGHEVYSNYIKVSEVNVLSYLSLGEICVNQKLHRPCLFEV